MGKSDMSYIWIMIILFFGLVIFGGCTKASYPPLNVDKVIEANGEVTEVLVNGKWFQIIEDY